MDLSLPELNGLDATRQILKTRRAARFSCSRCTLRATRARRSAGRRRGYILKSDADQSLIAAVESLPSTKFLTSKVTEFVWTTICAEPKQTTVSVHGAVTAREREILQLLAEGKSNKEAASTARHQCETIEGAPARTSCENCISGQPATGAVRDPQQDCSTVEPQSRSALKRLCAAWSLVHLRLHAANWNSPLIERQPRDSTPLAFVQPTALLRSVGSLLAMGRQSDDDQDCAKVA